MPTATNQVINVAMKASPRRDNGLRCDCFSPVMLAMIAAKTKWIPGLREKPARRCRHRRRRAGVRRGRIWIALRGDALPDQDREDDDCTNNQQNMKSPACRTFCARADD